MEIVDPKNQPGSSLQVTGWFGYSKRSLLKKQSESTQGGPLPNVSGVITSLNGLTHQ